MRKRSRYSRVMRRIRHVADADEVRSAKRRHKADGDLDAPNSAIERRLQPALIAVGAAALIVLVAWMLLG